MTEGDSTTDVPPARELGRIRNELVQIKLLLIVFGTGMIAETEVVIAVGMLIIILYVIYTVADRRLRDESEEAARAAATEKDE
jgi:hypothetical protein